MTTVYTQEYESETAQPMSHARIGFRSHARGLTASSVVASSEQAGFPADAPLREDTAERWKPVGDGTWRVDLGEPRVVDYVAVHGRGDVTIERSNDDASWAAFAESSGVNGPAIFLDSPVTARYWRISVSGDPELAVVFIGEILAMERPFFGGHQPVNLSRETQTRGARSRGGHFLGQDIVREGFAGQMAWQNLTPPWYREHFDPLIDHLRTKPAFFAWRPSGYPDDVLYAWTAQDIAPTQEARTPGGRYSVTVPVTGLAAAPFIWSPVLLFSADEQGALPRVEPQYLFLDASRTNPITGPGDPVGGATDLSGNGNHFEQTVDADRMIYRTGTVDGRTSRWLETNAVNQKLVLPDTPDVSDIMINTPWGHQLIKGAQYPGAANFSLQVPASGLVLREESLTQTQIDRVAAYYQTERVYFVSATSETTVSDLRAESSNDSTIRCIGANGEEYIINLGAASDTSVDLAEQGLTAPIAMVWGGELLTDVDLTHFYCHRNSLTGSIPDLSANTALTHFYCHVNSLTGSIPDLSANTELTIFWCHDNSLTGSIPDLSANTELTIFYCHDNSLTGSIPDLSANTALDRFYCHNNSLTGSIPDLSANTALDRFSCYSNSLTGSIPDLSNNTALTDFQCHRNSLTGSIPDLSANTELEQFYCLNNSLTDVEAGFSVGSSGVTLFRADGNDLVQSAVDTICVALDNSTSENGDLQLQGGTNAAPSATGEAAIDSLRNKGWTVTVTGGY